jgi:hypothetical protein
MFGAEPISALLQLMMGALQLMLGALKVRIQR